ncbi:MAG: ankyrin repeat domain-containing protein [Acidobacteriota bacterium]
MNLKSKVIFIILVFLSLSLYSQTMHEAIKKGDLQEVKSLVKGNRSLLSARYKIEKPMPIIRMAEEVSPLFDAVLYGRYEIIKYFIEEGVDLKKNNYALFLAMLQKGTKIKNLLIKNGARFVNDTAPPMRINILTKAVWFYPDLKLIEEIIDLGGGLELDWGKDGNYTHSPLGMATRHGKYPIAKLLVKKGAKLNLSRNNGQIGLHDAIYYSRRSEDKMKGYASEMLTFLLEHGGDKNHRDNNGYLPVEYAAVEGVLTALKILWDENYDINQCDYLGMTLLHKTVTRGYLDCVEFLLSKNFDINAKDKNGSSPLFYAYKYGHVKLADYLKSRGAKSEKLLSVVNTEKLLNKKLKTGQAYIWYLGRYGWAIKTKNNLILKPWEWGEYDPDNPSLANGNIVSDELINQNVLLFSSAKYAETLVPKNNLLRTKSPEFNISLLSKDVSESKQIKSIKIKPLKKNNVGSAEIFKDKFSNLLIISDGVKIYFRGYKDPVDQEFTKKLMSSDLAFFSVYGSRGELSKESIESAESNIKKYKPETLFHQSIYTRSYYHYELSRQLKKRGHKINLPVNNFPGDCFFYDNGKISKK